MNKTALFFPGQGSQYVGMAKDLHVAYPSVRQLYQLASDEIGVDIAKLSFEGPSEELKKTRFTQPAILLHSLAVLTALQENLPQFDYAAGHSLGEYGALAVTKALSFEDAIKAVVKRASLMEEACQVHPSTMAAILGLDAEKVATICDVASSTGIVVPANFNSSVQVVISGEPRAVKEAVVLAREAGAKRAVLLEVGGAFH
ncbi:MAG: ACP S-malonyltransferase, partial [Candidatus Zixiibacteriota bacterium]